MNKKPIYAQILFDSAKEVVRECKEGHPLKKKIYNFLENDFSGILNKRNSKKYSFEYEGSLMSDEVINFLVEQFQLAEFTSVQYNKKLLRENLTAYFDAQEDDEEQVYKKTCTFGPIWNEQLVKMCYVLFDKLS